MGLDYELRKLTQEQIKEYAEVDDYYIEYCQKEHEKHERLGNKREANFYYWILFLVDRLEEAAYEWHESQEEIRELEQYIQDWQIRPNLGKHFDARY